jgi:nucleoside-diphosphate-sugar epimerase
LFASTSETYGNGPNPKTEETLQCPNSPYSVSKLAAEKYLFYLKDAHDFPVTILRPFNTYGRKNNSHFVVERVVVQMLQGQTVNLGDPNPVRDLLYVDDHVDAYLLCMGNKRAIGEVFAFATGSGVSVRDLVDKLRTLTRFEGTVLWNTIPKRPLDIEVLIGSYAKAQHTLGWAPKVSLEEGLRRTVGHWKKRLSSTGPG